MKNKELSDLFDKMAEILEFKDENPFKINAYRKTSRVLPFYTRLIVAPGRLI
jgi:DNA polymerase/3'-5' exonuclease PolX